MLYPLVVSLYGPKTSTATVPKARIDEKFWILETFINHQKVSKT